MDDRLLLSEAISLVGGLIAAWPNSKDVADGYIGALAATLCAYPRSVAAKCCDPIAGVARETKFLPTVADLVAWCERNTEAMRRPLQLDSAIEETLRRRREDEDWQKNREERPTIDDLRAKHGPNWGIGKNTEADDLAARKAHAATIQAANERAWSRMGGTVSGGIIITDALRKTLQPGNA